MYTLADMMTTTDYLCTEGIVKPSISWYFRAGGGNIKVGRFEISCQLAAEIVEAYKVRKPRPTPITFPQGEDSPPVIRTYMIPMLDIDRDPGKTRHWLKFLRQFKPFQE